MPFGGGLMIRRSSLVFGCAVVGLIAHIPSSPAQAADGSATLAVHHSASAVPSKVVQTELKVITPAASRRGIFVVQAEPVQPGAAVGDRPAAKLAPPSANEPEEDYLSWKPISEVTATTTIKTAGVMDREDVVPKDWARPYFSKAGELCGEAVESRNWVESEYYWLASGFCCGPLYFEEINVERYGYRVGCLQPAVSAAHFFATIPLLPYKTFVHPPCECVYSLGYYRPGDCAPLQHEQFHLQADAAAAEGGMITGMILLFTH
jgi:hypothetical protein